MLEFFNFPALFSESCLDITTGFNFWRPIPDLKVELSIPLAIESANSADSGESSQLGQIAGVYSQHGFKVALSLLLSPSMKATFL